MCEKINQFTWLALTVIEWNDVFNWEIEKTRFKQFINPNNKDRVLWFFNDKKLGLSPEILNRIEYNINT